MTSESEKRKVYQPRSNMQGITAMKKPEYIEGPEALDNFENGIKGLFRVPKDAVPAKKKPVKKWAKTKTSERGVYRDSGEDT
jgi:hypothetical protein